MPVSCLRHGSFTPVFFLRKKLQHTTVFLNLLLQQLIRFLCAPSGNSLIRTDQQHSSKTDCTTLRTEPTAENDTQLSVKCYLIHIRLVTLSTQLEQKRSSTWKQQIRNQRSVCKNSKLNYLILPFHCIIESNNSLTVKTCSGIL